MLNKECGLPIGVLDTFHNKSEDFLGEDLREYFFYRGAIFYDSSGEISLSLVLPEDGKSYRLVLFDSATQVSETVRILKLNERNVKRAMNNIFKHF